MEQGRTTQVVGSGVQTYRRLPLPSWSLGPWSWRQSSSRAKSTYRSPQPSQGRNSQLLLGFNATLPQVPERLLHGDDDGLVPSKCCTRQRPLLPGRPTVWRSDRAALAPMTPPEACSSVADGNEFRGARIPPAWPAASPPATPMSASVVVNSCRA